MSIIKAGSWLIIGCILLIFTIVFVIVPRRDHVISTNLFPNVLKVLPKYRPILLTKDDASIHLGHTQYYQYLKSVGMG